MALNIFLIRDEGPHSNLRPTRLYRNHGHPHLCYPYFCIYISPLSVLTQKRACIITVKTGGCDVTNVLLSIPRVV